MSVQAPIQNQSYLNTNVAFFAPASTLGSSELTDTPANLTAGFLTFGLQGGGRPTGPGLEIVGINGLAGPLSTIGVVANSNAVPAALAAGGVYFDALGGGFTNCCVIKQSPIGTQQVYLTASNIGMQNLAVDSTLLVSTLNGIPYPTFPATATFRLLAGRATIGAGNVSTVTLATNYNNSNAMSITATPINTVNDKFHPLTLSSISISSFTVISDAAGVDFSWITNGPL
jgi:hypothetical protein